MKREPLLAGGNMWGKLHVLGKYVSRGRILESPYYLVASIRTSSVQYFGPVFVPCVFGAHDGGYRDTVIVCPLYALP